VRQLSRWTTFPGNVDISLQVKRGSITGIIGPNGCGKTTLFNSIVGYHPIDKGSIKFEGKEISHLLVGDIARLGMLRTFQQTRIWGRQHADLSLAPGGIKIIDVCQP